MTSRPFEVFRTMIEFVVLFVTRTPSIVTVSFDRTRRSAPFAAAMGPRTRPTDKSLRRPHDSDDTTIAWLIAISAMSVA